MNSAPLRSIAYLIQLCFVRRQDWPAANRAMLAPIASDISLVCNKCSKAQKYMNILATEADPVVQTISVTTWPRPCCSE